MIHRSRALLMTDSVSPSLSRGKVTRLMLAFSLNSCTYSMTYKRKLTTTRLSNLKRSRRGRNSSQDSINKDNIELETSASGAAGRPDAVTPPPLTPRITPLKSLEQVPEDQVLRPLEGSLPSTAHNTDTQLWLWGWKHHITYVWFSSKIGRISALERPAKSQTCETKV